MQTFSYLWLAETLLPYANKPMAFPQMFRSHFSQVLSLSVTHIPSNMALALFNSGIISLNQLGDFPTCPGPTVHSTGDLPVKLRLISPKTEKQGSQREI